MKTPFTIDQFFDVFKNYNQAVFPLQLLFYIAGVFAAYEVTRRGPGSAKTLSLILSLLWLWMGIVYQLIFFTAINKAAYIFGILFILQGILFLMYGVFNNKLSFRFRPGIYGVAGIIMILYALVVYPLIGYFSGHTYPYSPTFGLPCPTTIFTFGLLLQSDKKCPVIILVIPALWSVIGFMAAFSFGIAEDTGLILAGLFTFFMLLFRNRKLHQ